MDRRIYRWEFSDVGPLGSAIVNKSYVIDDKGPVPDIQTKKMQNHIEVPRVSSN